MANILDYIDWRGDLLFTEAPFNCVDNLIFSELCFMDFEGIIPENPEDGSIMLGAAVREYFQRHKGEKLSMGLIVPKEILVLSRKLEKSRRFSELKLTGYVNHIDTECQEQFSALTADLGDGCMYVAYRGTDDTLIGWKEDFNLAFMPEVPAQVESVRYLEIIAGKIGLNIRVGGHSKGGNLAVYAASKCSETYGSRIIEVYNNDGPGFSAGLLDSRGYRLIRSKITTIVPQTSVVGMLLEHDAVCTVVKSSAFGLNQHDGFSWQVLGSNFIESPEGLSSDSMKIDETVRAWVNDMTVSEREQFADALYQMLRATNATTLTELFKDKQALVKSYRSLDPEVKSAVRSTLRKLITHSGKTIKKSLKLPKLSLPIRRAKKQQ